MVRQDRCFYHSNRRAYRLGYCDACYGEIKRVKDQCRAAQKLGLVSDLTHEQWMQTLQYFKWRCAYCMKKDFQLIEHFIPLKLGGGTTISNCVPACIACNARKRDAHPDTIASPSLESVRGFLQAQISL